MTLFKRDRARDRRLTPPPPAPKPPTSAQPPTREAAPTAFPTPSAPAAEPAPAVTTRSVSMDFPRDAAAVIDRNTQLSGTLRSEGNVLIQGVFEGEIEAKGTIRVEESAQVQAQIRASNVVVSGSFDGKIVCQNRFLVTPTGSVKGEINTSILVVEEGSTVNCRFVMSREGR